MMLKLKVIKSGFILPSAAYTISKKQIQFRLQFQQSLMKKPEIGDLVYGSITHTGHHNTLENKEGRIHKINSGSKAIFVFGSRYAPDAYEGYLPDTLKEEVDLLARSGLVGEMKSKNANMADCTRVKIFGYVVDETGEVINTRKSSLFNFNNQPKTNKSSTKMILCIGAAMNSGKSQTAAKCCWALSSAGHAVNACKVTGTASLKDILLMEDNGAKTIADFSYLGFPSTYMIEETEAYSIFNTLKNHVAPSRGYWVVELADGLLQRETAYLLHHPDVRKCIHKLIFCAHDAVGMVGGLKILSEEFNLEPDALSGVCSSSPLAVREFSKYTDTPVFDNFNSSLKEMLEILI